METALYANRGKYRLMNLLMLGENAILRRHQILLRKTEYYINSGHRVLGKGHVVKNISVLQKPEILEYNPDLTTVFRKLFVLNPAENLAINGDFSFRWFQFFQQKTNQCGFS